MKWNEACSEHLSLSDSIVYAGKLARRPVEAAELAKLALDRRIDLFGRLAGTVVLRVARVDKTGILEADGEWWDMDAYSSVVECNGAISKLVVNGFGASLLCYLENTGDLAGFDPSTSLLLSEDGYFIDSAPLGFSGGLLLRSAEDRALFVEQATIANVGWTDFLTMHFTLLFRASELTDAFSNGSPRVEKSPRTSTQSINKQLQVLGAMAQAMIESGSRGASEDATLILRKLENKGFGDVVSQKTLARYLRDAYEQM